MKKILLTRFWFSSIRCHLHSLYMQMQIYPLNACELDWEENIIAINNSKRKKLRKKRIKCDQWIKPWLKQRNQQEQSSRGVHKYSYLKKKSQENTCSGVSIMEFQTVRPATLLKSDTSKVVKNTFVEYMQMAAPESVGY